MKNVGSIIDIRRRHPGHRIYWLTVAVIFLAAAPAMAELQESIIQFRSIEDASFPPDPAVCNAAPIPVNVMLGASLWSYQIRSNDGLVANDQAVRIGNATACTHVTFPLTFTPSTIEPFYIKFRLDNGDYAGEYEALGNCTIISNDVPTQGLILAGCSLKVTDAPSDSTHGAMTSMSVFNPFRLPGFNTGSMWTLHLYSS